MRVTGAIVAAEQELKTLVTHTKRWEVGDLSTSDLSALVQRAARKLQDSCYCQEAVCCVAHSKHVTPHKNCILR